MSNGEFEKSPHGGIVNNVAFTVASRLAMILASTVGLPVAGWLLVRGVSAVDVVQESVNTLLATQRVLDVKFEDFRHELTDHEARIRVLERPKPPGG